MGKIRSILSIGVLAALSGILSAAEHTKVEATWENAAAEEIQNALIPFSERAVMTVVEDGKATLYFNGQGKEVSQIMEKATDNLPKDFHFVRTSREQGEIPAAPAQSSQKKVTFQISADKAALFGIPTSDLSVHLAKLKAAHPDDLTAAFETAVFTLPDGKSVPIRNFAEIRMNEVKRPLVSRKP